jgi:hypothetical protein
MPSKHFDPTKPSFYLDNSTLCAAMKAHRLRADADKYSAYLPLIPWIERLAHEANLCMSTIHLQEPASWKDVSTARAMIEWYDRLPVVWTRSRYDDAEEFEAEYWTKVAAGVPVDGNGKAFAGSLLTAFRALKIDAICKLLAEPKPAVAVFDAKLDFSAYEDRFINLLVQVAQDHQAVDAEEWTEQRKSARMAYNIRVALRTAAQSADQRLMQRGDAAYLTKKCSAGEVQDMLVSLYDREPRSMPLFRVERKFIEGAASLIERGQVVNGKVSGTLYDKLRGSLGDWHHLLGAAYCDVFTCDGTVSTWLGDVRTTLGLRHQLAVKGYPGGAEGFVRDLMATWS